MASSIEVSQAPPRSLNLHGERSFSMAELTYEEDGTALHGEPQLVASAAAAVRQAVLQSEPVVLRLTHIGKSYPIAGSDERVVALKDITLAEKAGTGSEAARRPSNPSLPPSFGPVRRGEFVMIRGPSGGGKTTLLNIIGNIDSCTDGTIELNGRVIDKSTSENVLADIRLKSLGFVFQTFNLIATMTAAENVELPMTLMGKLSSKEMRLRSRQLLTLVGLRNRINHLPSELSGGEQQRVTIARSLANNPSLLLLDEPTGDLDTANTIEVMDLLMRINRRTKTTCIMVTHNPDIECYADRILYVSDGRFAKEVYNAVPTCLNLQAYTKYLADKEKQMTSFTQIGGTPVEEKDGTNSSSNVGSVKKLRVPIVEAAALDDGLATLDSISDPLPHRYTECAPLPRAQAGPPFAARTPRSNNASSTLPAVPEHSDASTPPAAVSSPLLQREEKEAGRGM